MGDICYAPRSMSLHSPAVLQANKFVFQWPAAWYAPPQADGAYRSNYGGAIYSEGNVSFYEDAVFESNASDVSNPLQR